MAVRISPLPLNVFPEAARPSIARLNRELRDLSGLEGTISGPRQARRSDNTIARREAAQVAVSRITPDISLVVSGSSTIIGTPNLTFGQTNTVGTTNTVVSVNSAIALFGTATPTDSDAGAAVLGSSAFAAHGDHKHLVSTAVPSFTLGTSATIGTTTTLVRSDATIAIFDATAPANPVATAATGSAAFAARRDHAHLFTDRLQSTANKATVIFTDNGTNATLTNSLGGLTITWPATGLQLGTTSGSATLNRMAIGRAVSSSFGFAIQGRYSNAGAALNFLAENISAGDTITGLFGNVRGRGIAGFSAGNTFKGCITSMQLRSTGHTAAAFIHYDTQMTVNATDATSNLSNRYGLLMEPNPDPNGSPAYGAVTNTYGVRVNDILFGTNRWAFYSVADKMFIGNKIAFTQTDENEYIDSLTDGELDLEGTTSVNLRVNGNEVIAVDAALVTINQDTFIVDGEGLVIGHTAQILSSNRSELQILGTSGADGSIIIARFSDNASPPSINLLKSRSTTIGSFVIVQDNDIIGQIKFNVDDGNAGNDYSTKSAIFMVEVDDPSPASVDVGSAYVWEQMPGGGGAFRETMRLNAAGNLSVGNEVSANSGREVTRYALMGG